ncbi:hypothetical protein C8R46DRAFT_347957 [Mycena filopes]|nr:hypothetical protein C8R46DRAFT_347957 [Mycena filopes]
MPFPPSYASLLATGFHSPTGSTRRDLCLYATPTTTTTTIMLQPHHLHAFLLGLGFLFSLLICVSSSCLVSSSLLRLLLLLPRFARWIRFLLYILLLSAHTILDRTFLK